MPGCKYVYPLRVEDKSVCASGSHRARCNDINISLSLLRGPGQVRTGGNSMNESIGLFLRSTGPEHWPNPVWPLFRAINLERRKKGMPGWLMGGGVREENRCSVIICKIFHLK